MIVLSLCFHFGVGQHNETHREKLSKIDFLIGEWNVEVDARLAAQGPWEKSRGISIIRKTLDSALLEEDFTGTREGKPFLTKSLIAVNNQTNHFQRSFIDSPHGTLIDYEGSLTGNELVFDKTWTYANGSNVLLRTVYRKIAEDRFLLESMRMPQGESVWDTTTKMIYTRKK